MYKTNKAFIELKNSIILNKNIIINLIKIIIAAGLLSYIIFKINFNDVISSVETADKYLILIAFLLVFLNLSLQYIKWHLTIAAILKVNDKKKTFYSLFYGIAAGSFTPLRLGEYFGRAIVFKDKSIIDVTVATFIDKLFLLITVLFFGSISSVLFLQFHYEVNIYLTLSLLAVLFSLFGILIILLLNSKAWNNILFDKFRFHRKLNRWLQKLYVLKRLDRKYIGKMMVISFLDHFCYIIQFAILAIAFSKNFYFLKFIWVTNIIMFIKTIIPSISLGDLGIREGVSVFFFSKMGSTAAIGFNASIFLFLINLIFPSLIGLFLLTKKNNV
ncbi:MAG TPA: flippase-like domain-containing protein [Ignavibacteria bacterium]|nr:flippase-like domain-containing protein [Ignavibacteria bacterium]